MKTLYINGKFLSQRTTGVQRYAAEITRAWDADLKENRIDPARYKITVLAPHGIKQPIEYERINVVRCTTSGRLWEQCELPWISAGNLLFSPYAAAPVCKGRHVVTIHDAGAAATPEQYSFAFRAYYSSVYRSLAKTCDAVITVSEFSKAQLHRHFGIPLERMAVVPPGCDYLQNVPADASVLEQAGLEPGKFVLGVSSQSRIKNFDGLARAWKMLDIPNMKLAIAGGVNTRVFSGTRSSSQNGKHVALGYVSDGALRALYQTAALFVYPSFYEGFGLPPLEAMSNGCPAVVARSSALPEACGDAAMYCDPGDVADIARKISIVLGSSTLSDELRQRGRERAVHFTIRKAAALLWDEISKYA